MKKRSLIVLAICLLLVFISIVALSAYFTDYNTTIKANWGISLPRGYKESFSADSGPSFLGDGERYHIFDYKEGLRESDIDKFNSGENISMETEVHRILDLLQLSNQEKPDLSKEYYWYEKYGKDDPRDKLYIIYFIGLNKMYVVEEFC